MTKNNKPKIDEGNFCEMINQGIKEGRHADYLKNVLVKYEEYKKFFDEKVFTEQNPKKRHIYRFKAVYLKQEGVWRVLELEGSQTFNDLAEAIITSMSWQNDHMHGFRFSEKRIKGPEDWGLGKEIFCEGWEDDPFPTFKSNKIKISEINYDNFPQILFEFDFGDSHIFKITLEQTRRAGLGETRGHFPKPIELVGEPPDQYPPLDEDDGFDEAMAAGEEQEEMAHDEHFACSIFEDLLFLRTEKFMDKTGQEEAKKYRLSDKEIEFLARDGLLNRIFRRWFQTTWLWQDNSQHFSGTTPRQDLAKIHPDLNQGGGYLSVELKKEKGNLNIAPVYLSQERVFEMGLENLKKQGKRVVSPNFDAEFGVFVAWLNKGMRALKDKKALLTSGNDFNQYLKLFWELVPINIAQNCQMKLNQSELASLALGIDHCLFDFFASQPYGEDNFLSCDELFFRLWDVLKSAKKDLPELNVLTERNEIGGSTIKDKKLKEAAEIFYRLGVAFDRYVLFPLDRYFGGAEIVWTDQQCFFNDFSITISLLKEGDTIREKIEQSQGLDIGDIALNLRYLWFAPPSFFRLLGPTFQYLH